MRKRRVMTWQEITYGIIVLALVLFMIIYTAIEGRSIDPNY